MTEPSHSYNCNFLECFFCLKLFKYFFSFAFLLFGSAANFLLFHFHKLMSFGILSTARTLAIPSCYSNNLFLTTALLS